MFFEQ